MLAERREFVRNRAGSRCEYCCLRSDIQLLPFHIEHIVAEQHGGNDDNANLAWACDRCNAYKGTNLASVDPETGNVVEIFHPRRDIWSDHFAFKNGEIRGRRVDLRRELGELGPLDD
jgi:hypothetical protein